jgi:secreted PhoX family phosphatase
VLEDNGSDLGRQPATGGVNELYLLGKGRGEPRLFAVVRQEGGEPTGPWFHPNGRVMYLSIQADPSYILAVRGPWMKGIKH